VSWLGKAESFCGLEVDDRLDLPDSFHERVDRLFTIDNLIDVA
jgi:hypothetical protein